MIAERDRLNNAITTRLQKDKVSISVEYTLINFTTLENYWKPLHKLTVRVTNAGNYIKGIEFA